MKCKNLCNCKNIHLLVILSLITLVLSGLVSIFEMELWLAGTQWILISIVLAVYALILSVHGCGCGSESEGCSCGCGSDETETTKGNEEQE